MTSEAAKRVAVVQAGSFLFDTPRTLEHARGLVREAAQAGAELILFPEAFVGGYPKGMDFGARVGSRTPEGREWFRRYWASAIELPGPELQRMCGFALEARATLVVGVIERDGGTLYCTVVFIGPDGRLLGKHRKLMPTASERLIWGQGDGSSLPVLATPVGRVGAAICWENYMPMYRQYLYSQGLEVWCAPTVDERDIWQASMRHIAYEGRCFVLSACQHLTPDHCPPGYAQVASMPEGRALIRGGSVIVSPFGEVLAGPVYDRECVLTAEIDLNEVVRGKFDLDVTGHYARPDVFQLRVDRQAKTAVQVTGSSTLEPPAQPGPEAVP